MKRLIKKADHDWYNRDSAFVYINGKIYEATTHALCLQDFYNENNQQFLDNNFDRPDNEKFEEISREVGPVVLGHLVKQSDKVFIIFGFINGTYVEFNQIDNSILTEISNYFGGMECLNDLEHNETEEENEKYDKNELNNNINKDIEKRMQERFENVAKEIGFKKKDDYYTNNEDTNIQLSNYGVDEDYFADNPDDAFSIRVYKFGSHSLKYNIQEFENVPEELFEHSNAYNYFMQYDNCKITVEDVDTFKVSININNKKLTFEMISDYSYAFLEAGDDYTAEVMYNNGIKDLSAIPIKEIPNFKNYQL